MCFRIIATMVLLIACVSSYKSYGQDSLQVISDTIKIREIRPKNGKVYDPDKAALLSAVLPGLGHIYIKQYWKVPFVVGGAAAVYIFFKANNKNYKSFRNAQYLLSNSQAPINIDPRIQKRFSQNNIVDLLDRNARNTRRLRDLTIIAGCIAYGLIIADSYVSAHLKGFTVTKNLSFKLKPSCQPTAFSGPAPGLGLNLTFN